MSRPRKTRYARLQGTAWRHRVTSALSVEAWSLWTRCLSYCPDGRTDGVVPQHMLRAIAGGRVTDRQVKAGLEECLAAGVLATRADGDYEVVGYLDHNISRNGDDARLERDNARKGNAESFRSETAPVSEPIPNPTLTHDSGLRTQDTDHDQQRSLKTGHARAPGESESDHAARVALQAYVAAEESAGSLVQWTTGSAYAQLVLVHRLAVAQGERTGQPAIEVLAAWARRYVGERHKRHPKWWADCVNDWLAAPAKVAVVERRGSLPVATREQLLADALDEEIR